MRLKFALLFCFLFFASSGAWAIRASINSSIVFQASKKTPNLCDANILISWRAQNNTLHFKKNNKEEYYAELMCMIRISTDTGVIKEDLFTIKTPAKKNAEELRAQLIMDQYYYPIALSGTYMVDVALMEPNYKEEVIDYQNTHTLNLSDTSTVALSDIRLLDSSFMSKEKNVFTQEGIFDLPLNSNFLNETKQQIHFWFQIAALKQQLPLPVLVANAFISFKPFDKEVPGLNISDTLALNGKAAIETFRKSIPTNCLPSGNYYLNVVLKMKDSIWSKKTSFFQLYNPNPIKKQSSDSSIKKEVDTSSKSAYNQILDLTNTFVGKYNASQVRAILKMLLLICDATEAGSIYGFLKKPDELYSKYFIYNFWEKRNKANPEEAWKAYADKIKEVNKLFRGSGIPGYETDRGRIYIQYGKPNDRIIVNNETGALPYEIWQYYFSEKQGREGLFLFYKPGKSLGDYQLLHSTFMTEKRNPNWRSLLYSNSIMGNNTANGNSQAEQYIGNK